VHQAPPPTSRPVEQPAASYHIAENKKATAAGRDIFKPSTVQNNTVQQTATEVLTAVVSIVAINGGSYGNIDITQTGGTINQTINDTGGSLETTI
jgi:hypothetical protein